MDYSNSATEVQEFFSDIAVLYCTCAEPADLLVVTGCSTVPPCKAFVLTVSIRLQIYISN